MSEHDEIVEATKIWLKKQGYYVHGSLKLGKFIADVIGIRNQHDSIAIEIKSGNISEIRKGLGQSHTYLDYVHKVYLAIPKKHIKLGRELVKHTRVGLLIYSKEEKIVLMKEAKYIRPIQENLAFVLSKTTGFCWVCSRTFNIVPKYESSFYIAHEDIDPKLYEGLVKTLKIRPQTKGYWVDICQVCSRVIYQINMKFLNALIFGESEFATNKLFIPQKLVNFFRKLNSENLD